MKILVISDLHLTPYDKNHKKQDEDLSKFLLEYLEKVDKIVFNGDTFEMLHCIWNEERLFKKMKKAFPKAISIIKNNSNISIVEGNHDLNLKRYLGKYTTEKYFISDKKHCIYFEHGHLVDNFYKKNILLKFSSFITRFLFTIDVILFGRRLTNKWLDFVRKKRIETGDYKLYAKKILNGCDGCVLSHTHIPQIHIEANGKFYLNTGTLMRGDCFEIDTEKEYKIKQIFNIFRKN